MLKTFELSFNNQTSVILDEVGLHLRLSLAGSFSYYNRVDIKWNSHIMQWSFKWPTRANNPKSAPFGSHNLRLILNFKPTSWTFEIAHTIVLPKYWIDDTRRQFTSLFCVTIKKLPSLWPSHIQVIVISREHGYKILGWYILNAALRAWRQDT